LTVSKKLSFLRSNLEARYKSHLSVGLHASTSRNYKETDMKQVADFLNEGVDIAVAAKIY